VANRLFSFVAALCTLVVCGAIFALVAARSVDPRQQFVSLSNAFHLSIYGDGAGGRLWVFNDSSYGPYMGSVIGIAGDPNGPKVSGVGDMAGVYYRMIRWPNGAVLWTLSFSLWYPLLFALPVPIVWLIRRTRHTRRGFPVE
jgi:hypothetical protein